MSLEDDGEDELARVEPEPPGRRQLGKPLVRLRERSIEERRLRVGEAVVPPVEEPALQE